MSMSVDRHIHVVSFNVPYPADYGGVIDVYFRLQALHREGVSITLHCFDYGRGEQPELNKLCQEVYYYKRRSLWRGLTSSLPLFVAARRSSLLTARLLLDDDPILLEGLHTSALMLDHRIDRKRCYIRLHNDEAVYYRSLAGRERSWWKRLYFELEARRLEQFEHILEQAAGVFTISRPEQEKFAGKYKNILYTGPFHAWQQTEIKTGRGSYILYYGNLSVNENEEAVRYLLDELSSSLPAELVIAGKEPSPQLQAAIAGKKQVRLISDPDQNTMLDLIRQAQVLVLPTFQPTGIKLKLIDALFNGRHIIVNSPMIAGTGLEDLVTIADDPVALRQMVQQAWETEFTDEMVSRRRAHPALPDNRQAVTVIMKKCFPVIPPAASR